MGFDEYIAGIWETKNHVHCILSSVLYFGHSSSMIRPTANILEPLSFLCTYSVLNFHLVKLAFCQAVFKPENLQVP